MTSRRPTLKDVAARAAVSVSTASLVFSGKGPVADETAERVRAAADELGYAGPDPVASSLRAGRSGVVAVIVDAPLTMALRDPYAVQVLDGLAQTGIPSRAEVTDASMSVRAECVMLNKGPFIARAVRVLHDILRRMERHTYKKRQLFRRLALSTHTREERQGRSRDLN